VVRKARSRYRSLLLTTNLKVALQVESTICHCFETRRHSDSYQTRNSGNGK
jgi:hypothetical protein